LTEKRNILVLFWGKKGGGAHYSLKIAEEFSKREDLNLFLSLSSYCTISNLFQNLNAETCLVNTYKSSFGFLNMMFFRRYTIRKKLQDFISTNQIDIVIIGMDFFWGDLIFKASCRAAADTIYVVHEPKPHPNEPIIMSFFKKWKIKKSVNRAGKVVVLTHHVKNYLIEKFRISKNKISVIPHGIFSYFSADEPKSIQPDKINDVVSILYFGRIDYYKGLDILLKAYRILERCVSNIRLEIWGNGDLSMYQDDLNNLSNARVENRWIDESEISDIFQNCDICVLPYRDASQSGIAGIAQQAGIPIVACPSKGLKEQLKEAGAIFSDDFSPESLASKIEELINDPVGFNHLSMKSLEYASKLSWKNIANQFITVADTIKKENSEHL